MTRIRHCSDLSGVSVGASRKSGKHSGTPRDKAGSLHMDVGVLWFIAVVIGTLLLGVGIAYAQMQWRARRRDRSTKEAQKHKVKSLYNERSDENEP